MPTDQDRRTLHDADLLQPDAPVPQNQDEALLDAESAKVRALLSQATGEGAGPYTPLPHIVQE